MRTIFWRGVHLNSAALGEPAGIADPHHDGYGRQLARFEVGRQHRWGSEAFVADLDRTPRRRLVVAGAKRGIELVDECGQGQAGGQVAHGGEPTRFADDVGAVASERGVQEPVEGGAGRYGPGQDLTEHLDGALNITGFAGQRGGQRRTALLLSSHEVQVWT